MSFDIEHDLIFSKIPDPTKLTGAALDSWLKFAYELDIAKLKDIKDRTWDTALMLGWNFDSAEDYISKVTSGEFQPLSRVTKRGDDDGLESVLVKGGVVWSHSLVDELGTLGNLLARPKKTQRRSC